MEIDEVWVQSGRGFDESVRFGMETNGRGKGMDN